MKVSMKGDYGVRALVELAHHYGEGPVQSAHIANRQGIPEPYLDQLLTSLRRAGFIRSVRGPQGGHALIRDPHDLKLSEAVSALEGSLSPIGCLDDPDGCPKTLNSVCVPYGAKSPRRPCASSRGSPSPTLPTVSEPAALPDTRFKEET